MSPLFKGIFLTSNRPEKTAEFYRVVAHLALEQVGNGSEYVYWKIDTGGMQLAIHDAAKFAAYAHPARADSNLTHLYFRVESQQQFLAHLKKLNITPYGTDDVVVIVVDPDGRKVMFGTA